MIRKKRSALWTCFMSTSSIEAQCNLCHKCISVKGGNISNLSRHLRSLHPDVVLVRVKQEDQDIPAAKTVPTRSFKPRKEPREDKGVQHPSRGLDSSSSTSPPSTRTPPTTTPKSLGHLRSDIMEKLKSSAGVCLTVHIWTTTTTYMTVSCHFIEDFQMVTYLLDCLALTGRHTPAQLAKELIRIANEWAVGDKIVACVCDEAGDVASALSDYLHWDHVPCFPLMLDQIVSSALGQVEEIRRLVSTTVEFFHKSASVSRKLSAGYVQKDHEEMGAGPDAASWSSTVHMLRRFVEVKEDITSTLALLGGILPTLTPEQWDIAGEIVDILKPFEEVSTEVRAEKCVPASQVMLMTRGLHALVARNQRNPSTFAPVRNLVDTLMIEMSSRFVRLEKTEKLSDAICLDPRFKSKGFVYQRVAEETIKRVTEVAERVHLPQPEPAASSSSRIWEDFDERVRTYTPDASDASMEMLDYLASPLLSRCSDPLAWWWRSSSGYKRLTEVMKTRLCIVATSVPSERIFSRTLQILSDTTNQPAKVSEMVFLSANVTEMDPEIKV